MRRIDTKIDENLTDDQFGFRRGIETREAILSLKKKMNNYNNCLEPNEKMCIDESLVKFMGRLAIKQYIQNKRDRFGIKEFKLCIFPCYTIAIKIYCGKEKNISDVRNVGSNVVMKLAKPYLDNDRTLYVDNWYSSVELAEQLQSRQTHLVGTLQ